MGVHMCTQLKSGRANQRAGSEVKWRYGSARNPTGCDLLHEGYGQV